MSGDVSPDSDRLAAERVVLQVLKDLTADWDTDYAGPIGPETQLIGDLDFESIDVVELVVSLEGRLQRKDLPFEKLLMQDGRYVEDLTVGQVVDFVRAQLSAASPGGANA